jgi:hypothetical protein
LDPTIVDLNRKHKQVEAALDVLSQSSEEGETVAVISQREALAASLQVFSKVRNSGTGKVKRAFLYLLLPLFEGGRICPYVKLGYLTMDTSEDVWEKLRLTLRRYGTSCNDYYYELFPISNFVAVMSLDLFLHYNNFDAYV